MTYYRVCPRDLFNESNLLKCIGKIILLIGDNKIPGLNVVEECDEGFIIDQDPCDGSIFINNINFTDEDGNAVTLEVPLNSRDPWPLVIHYKDEGYYPLNSEGEYQLAANLFTND